ncbi:uncharacterized protein LOC8067591 [Sorghum bicolor]|uniref:uncharacterized protein LOC8067591 n=1 Tax=Sorghum bicolor TaxID=4558 RepID=UPI000B425697|nr:uncharacterized protein LOC8067591 [Sorghum bicolor]|eukprot:XP_021317034.1 uncharacterized protein LOC8067591 [Sorghum bicolor]
MGPALVALAPILLAIACMSLSLIRLHGIANHPTRHDEYGGPNNDGGNLKPALILFYSLVLAQGVLFLLWFPVAMNRLDIAKPLGSKYLANELLRRKKNLENHSCSSRNNYKDQVNEEEEMELVDRYVTSIAETCIEKDLCLREAGLQACSDATLLTSENLLVSSIPQPQRIETIVKQTKNDLGADIKAHIAEIVAKLACKLRLADIPGAAHCISSLIDYSHPISMKVRNQAGRSDDDRGGVNYQLRTTDDIESEMSRDREEETRKPLFLHGLVILRELAADLENCREMYNTMDLVPKIIAPISSGLLMAIKNDETTVEIVRESLRVMSKLTRGTGESSRKLCHELTTKYGSRTAENILWILSNSSDQDMRMLAVEILSRLNLDQPIMLRFTDDLQCLLFDPQDIPLRIKAGKALIACGHEFPDIQQLVTIISADEYSKEYRVVTAEILAQMCARSRADHDRINRLISDFSVANTLSTVLKAIVTETTNITELDKSNRNFLASFLGLAVQIREKLATAEAFAVAITGLQMGNNIIFAETLKRIIEMTNHSLSDNEARLAIMKSETKLVAWMTEIDTISPGYYIDYLRRENIVQKLDAAVKDMAHLERYMVMTGGADEKEGYVMLQTLVETTKNKLVP